ncbi:insulinase family protein [Vibrio salinus]|uniref:insulinase family protein n=1 Tax=Vibrio salinus TaxID=2899784 RepID=UPI001E35EDCA|nr:insulinase family protein [Vibrio salinus]MCE0494568.1 insulinase family protein [Vibrio salinus]
MRISPNDSKSYRYLTLSNKLRLLLIHDENASRSAAALAVNVGHFDDPISREGLAHYLEHMLFLGTEKYPKIGEFQNFINQYGGAHNAWTGTEHSCFFFDITPKAFHEALERFSQFFSAPLFNEEALDKERQAIESEYRLKLKDETRRLYQVHKETINQAHPFAKFSVGNSLTLADRNDTSIREEILEFHKKNYSSDLMTLAIVGPQELDVLENWCQTFFSAVPNHSLSGKTLSEPYVTKDHTSLFIKVNPVKDIRKLILSFPLPEMQKYYRSKPLSYFAHLLGYEGPGSLMLALKNKEWINSLSAGGGASGSNYREFNISMQLTESGLKHTDDIIQAVFNYIRLIDSEGFQSWRYDEKRAVMESAFQFQETSRPLDMVSHLAMNMQHYDQNDTIYGDYMMDGLEVDIMAKVLTQLTPDNLRATLLAKEGSFDLEAKWYFTPYSVNQFTPEQIQFYQQSADDLDIQLPPENPFICNNLIPKAIENPDQIIPEIIEEKSGFRLWHMQDTEFRVPKGVIYVAIDSPYAVKNTRNIVITRLCVEMFLDTLAKQTYPAEIAGINYNMYTHQGGVTLSISGFSQKQPELLKMILNKFATREFSSKRFESIKQQLHRSWSNASKDRPISQLFNCMTGLLQPNNPPYEDLLSALETIDVSELDEFVKEMMNHLHIEMFVFGDWHKQDALKIGNTLRNALSFKEQTYEESLRPLVMLGKHGTFSREITCNQDDSAVVVYYQSENTSVEDIALYSLANHLMSATFFNEIRTKQQLGYMVGTGNLPLNKHPGIVLYVQSPNAGPAQLMDAIDEFLNAFYMVLLELNEYQWHSSKRGLWNQIATPDPTLRSRAQRLWVAIGNKDYEFNQKERVLESLRALSRVDMIRFIIRELKPRTANRLVMHTQGLAHKEQVHLHLGQPIGSIKEFQLMPKD